MLGRRRKRRANIKTTLCCCDIPTFFQNCHQIVHAFTLNDEQVLHIEPAVFGPAYGQNAAMCGIQQVYHLE